MLTTRWDRAAIGFSVASCVERSGNCAMGTMVVVFAVGVEASSTSSGSTSSGSTSSGSGSSKEGRQESLAALDGSKIDIALRDMLTRVRVAAGAGSGRADTFSSVAQGFGPAFGTYVAGTRTRIGTCSPALLASLAANATRPG